MVYLVSAFFLFLSYKLSNIKATKDFKMFKKLQAFIIIFKDANMKKALLEQEKRQN